MKNRYKVIIANTQLNVRQSIIIYACSCIEAGMNARAILGDEGYDFVESINCIIE